MCVVTLLVTGVVCLVRRKRRGQERAENVDTTIETTISHPYSIESPASTITTERREERRPPHVYRTMLHDRDHPLNTLMTSMFLGSKLKSSKDGCSVEREDYDNPLAPWGSDECYQSIQENQVQRHQYASLGAIAEEEGSVQSYI